MARELDREIGARIQTARLEAWKTQAQLGAAIGLTRSSVANIEAGRQAIGAVELALAADALCVPVGRLLSLDGGPGDYANGYSAGWRDAARAFRAAAETKHQELLHAVEVDRG